jgi:hypothetical protein
MHRPYRASFLEAIPEDNAGTDCHLVLPLLWFLRAEYLDQHNFCPHRYQVGTKRGH